MTPLIRLLLLAAVLAFALGAGTGARAAEITDDAIVATPTAMAALIAAAAALKPGDGADSVAPAGAAAEGAAARPRPGFIQRLQDRATDLVATSMAFIGLPYRRGGTTTSGFDCSGFVRHIFERSLGLVLPRRADEQAGAESLVAVEREELQPGDLVFFNTLRRRFSHVGIYVGDGKFIHSPHTGARVRVEDMRASYWERRFTGGRRANAMLADAGDVVSATSP